MLFYRPSNIHFHPNTFNLTAHDENTHGDTGNTYRDTHVCAHTETSKLCALAEFNETHLFLYYIYIYISTKKFADLQEVYDLELWKAHDLLRIHRAIHLAHSLYDF